MELNDAANPFQTAAQDASPPRPMNWAACPSVTIDAAHPERLPDNIRAIRVAQFDEKTLKAALSLMQSSVQVVQVEIEDVEQARKQLRSYIYALPSIEWNSAGSQTNFVKTKTITEHLTKCFTGEVNAPYMHGLRYAESEAIDMITSPTLAARKVFPSSNVHSLLLGKLNEQKKGPPDFHDHVEHTGYYIILSEGENDKAKGTFFLSSHEATAHQVNGKPVVSYNTDKPTIYEGKPGAYLIFTVGDHPQKAALHAIPVGPFAHRVTSLTQVILEQAARPQHP